MKRLPFIAASINAARRWLSAPTPLKSPGLTDQFFDAAERRAMLSRPLEPCCQTQVFDKSLLRWYYNTSTEFPNVVSVDFGDPSSEIKLHSMICYCGCFSQFRRGEQPQFWAETIGVLRISDGTGTISKE